MIKKTILSQDSLSIQGNWIHLPCIIFLIIVYFKALIKLLINSKYNSIIVNNHKIYENHLGNYAIVKKAPVTWMIASHVLMATFWALATLTQKLLVWGMVKSDKRAKYCTRLHIILGTAMCIVGIFGCSIGGFIAYLDHNHTPMRWFLMLLPCSFLPSITLTWITAKKRNIIDHRFWATTAFIGPCLSSLWAEELIYRLGRQTPLGPWSGELWGTGIAATLHLLTIVLPAWFVRQQQLSSYNQSKTDKTTNQTDNVQLTDDAASIPQRVKVSELAIPANNLL